MALGPRPPEEFYDLTKDPWEMENLADSAEHADARKALARRLDDYLARTSDPRTGETDVFGGLRPKTQRKGRESTAAKRAPSPAKHRGGDSVGA